MNNILETIFVYMCNLSMYVSLIDWIKFDKREKSGEKN